MWKIRLLAVIIFLAGASIGYFNYASEETLHSGKEIPGAALFSKYPFKLGLDLSGGAHLVYKADLSKVSGSDSKDAMEALRDVIERRVNLFGVAEPIVQTEESSQLLGGGEKRLIVELPGVTNVSQAIAMIGATPTLEFKTERPDGQTKNILESQQKGERINEDPFASTGLTGRFLKNSRLDFDSTTREAMVSLEFNDEGTALFREITKSNVGKLVAIYLDGAPISAPVVREEIADGKAVISGNFTPEEAKTLVGRLNSGALPVPISLLSTESIGPSLGDKAIKAGIVSGLYGLFLVAIFLMVWYRLPGLISILALGVYIVIMLALFKLIPITLSAAGIAGFILSIGMAVDANILIFERMKEELRSGSSLESSLREGFARAWTSIRDSNISSMITAVILFWFGTSLIEGFALTFGLGVLVSMFSAITVSRVFLLTMGFKSDRPIIKFLFGSGFIPNSKF